MEKREREREREKGRENKKRKIETSFGGAIIEILAARSAVDPGQIN